MNSAGARAKPTFVYESLARSRSRPASTIDSWSKATAGSALDREPLGVVGDARVAVARDEAEVRRRELPLLW